jgi:molybdopterin-guanine dinucleotide biosynthesis protein MobB
MIPPTVCVVGKKNSGKTTLTIQLVAELDRRGWRVLAAKHGHGFELDTPGTDSWRHRHEGGARRVALVGPDSMAVLGEWDLSGEPTLEEVVERFLADADIVVAEGFKTSSFPRIEVFRKAAHLEPVFGPQVEAPERWLAIVSDVEDLEAPCPVFRLEDPMLLETLADLVEDRVMGRGR